MHLTFAERAYALARWYRERGAKVVLGGLHVLSCPDEAAPHADALAIGDGVQLWGEILRDVEAGRLQPVYHGDFRRPYRDDPPPRRDLLPRESFLTTTSLIATRGCHNRCGFCYLSTKGLHMPYLVRDVEQIVDEFAPTASPTPSSSTTISARGPITCGGCAGLCAAGEDLERGGDDRRHRRSRRWSAKWRWPAARACSSASSR